jgi:hypothetical protein
MTAEIQIKALPNAEERSYRDCFVFMFSISKLTENQGRVGKLVWIITAN